MLPIANSSECGAGVPGDPCCSITRVLWKNLLGLSIQESGWSRCICPDKWASTRSLGRLLSKTYSSVTAVPADRSTHPGSSRLVLASFSKMVTSFTGMTRRDRLFLDESIFILRDHVLPT